MAPMHPFMALHSFLWPPCTHLWLSMAPYGPHAPIYGSPCLPMAPMHPFMTHHGSLWPSSTNLWLSKAPYTTIYDSPWLSMQPFMALHGSLWPPCTHLWLSMAPYGPHAHIYGSPCLPMAPMHPFMALHGSLWPHAPIYGSSWPAWSLPSLSPFGPISRAYKKTDPWIYDPGHILGN